MNAKISSVLLVYDCSSVLVTLIDNSNEIITQVENLMCFGQNRHSLFFLPYFISIAF